MPSVQKESGYIRHLSQSHFTLNHDRAVPGSSSARRGSVSRRLSHQQSVVINVDDDAGPSRESGSSRPTNRRRTTSGARDHPVFVLDDADEGASTGTRRVSNGAQSAPILVLDSDDEQGQPQTSTSASGSGPRRRIGGLRRRGGRLHAAPSSSFRIFSPSPPPRQHHPVPPVPPLPPVIAEPMPFALLPPAPNNNNAENRPRLPFDEPPQPSGSGSRIHLGGGLFSQGSSTGRRRGPRPQIHFQAPRDREQEFDELFGESPPPSTVAAARSSALSRLSSFVRTYVANPSRRITRMNAGDVLAFGTQHAPGAEFFGFAFGAGPDPWARRNAAVGLGPDYEPSMTHPGRAGPGWTFDFGMDADSEAKKDAEADGAEILVCARCMDPLLANADGMVDVGAEERRERRVWGLRCGHVLDGKCVGALMSPDTENEKEADGEGNGTGNGVNAKGKGKQKEVRPADADADEREVAELVNVPDIKGKGKAPAIPPRAPTLPPPTLAPALDSTPEDTSMRSRLRPRHTAAPIPPSPSHASPRRSTRHARTHTDHIPSPSTTRRRGTKRKRGTGAGDEVVEARYEWTCPVAGCGRAHESVRVGRVWKMDPEKGAVGLFV